VSELPNGKWHCFVDILGSGEKVVWVMPPHPNCEPVEVRYVEDSRDGMPKGLKKQMAVVGALPLAEVLDLLPQAVEATRGLEDQLKSIASAIMRWQDDFGRAHLGAELVTPIWERIATARAFLAALEKVRALKGESDG